MMTGTERLAAIDKMVKATEVQAIPVEGASQSGLRYSWGLFRGKVRLLPDKHVDLILSAPPDAPTLANVHRRLAEEAVVEESGSKVSVVPA